MYTNVSVSLSHNNDFLKIVFKMFISERERETECEWGRGRERERETQNVKRLQALSCQHRA